MLSLNVYFAVKRETEVHNKSVCEAKMAERVTPDAREHDTTQYYKSVRSPRATRIFEGSKIISCSEFSLLMSSDFTLQHT